MEEEGEMVDSVVVSVKEVMEEEWEIMRTENSDLPQLTPRRPRKKKRAALSALLDPATPPGGCKRQPPCNMMFDSDEEYEVTR